MIRDICWVQDNKKIGNIMQKVQTEYEKGLYQYPFQTEKCEKHRLATRIFKGLDDDARGEQCECCGRKVGSEDVQHYCCYSNTQLAFLGPGIPLLFSFILVTIGILVVISLVFSAFALASNILGEDCNETKKCSPNIFNTLAIVNKIDENDYLSVQNYVLLGFVLLFVFLSQWVRYNFRKIEEDCDEMSDSPSDYAIIIRRLPEGTIEQEIEKLIDEERGFLDQGQRQLTENLRVKKILLSYDMDDYLKVKENNLSEFKDFVKENDPNNYIPNPLPALMKPGSLAIVVFARQQAKQVFLYKPNLCQKMVYCFCDPCIPLSDFRVGEMRVSVGRAPEPDDIIWENAKESVGRGVARKILFNLLSLCLLCAGGGAQYALARYQNGVQDERQKLILSGAASLLVAVMNKIIQFFLVFTSRMQKNPTQTEYNKVLMIKISFFLFLNSGLFLVVANVIANQQFSLEGELAYEVTLVMVLNAITPNLAVFVVETCSIIMRLKVWLVNRNWFVWTQLQANKAYEYSCPEIPYKYGYVMKTLWLSAFYAPLVPIVVPISIAGLTFNYWLEKYSYGKAYSVPNMISSEVNEAATELLDWTPLIFSLGEFLVYLYFENWVFADIPDYWSVPIYVSLGLSTLILLLPLRQINKKMFKLKSDDMSFPPYEKIQDNFQVTYEMTNPAYECTRKRKHDVYLWKLLFQHQDSHNSHDANQSANPLQQALVFAQPTHQPPPEPMPTHQNPFEMLGNQQYPALNTYQNTADPYTYNRNL